MIQAKGHIFRHTKRGHTRNPNPVSIAGEHGRNFNAPRLLNVNSRHCLGGRRAGSERGPRGSSWAGGMVVAEGERERNGWGGTGGLMRERREDRGERPREKEGKSGGETERESG